MSPIDTGGRIRAPARRGHLNNWGPSQGRQARSGYDSISRRARPAAAAAAAIVAMWGHGSLHQVMAGGFLLHLVMGTVYTYVACMDGME